MEPTHFNEVSLVPGRDFSVQRGHPWIFSGAIKKDPKSPREGELVRVLSSSGRVLGIGLYSSRGSIAVKMLSFSDEPINLDFWKKRVTSAVDRRRSIGLLSNSETSAYRLINAEGDSVPGLIVDFYTDTAVLQFQNPALENFAGEISTALVETIEPRVRRVFLKSNDQENNPSRYLWGEAGVGEMKENGYKFVVDWERGQKTGFFLDQRENRRLLGSFCRDKRVLNAFCYTGGFSIYALGGGATSVVSLDSSKPALQLLEKNIESNFPSATHETVSEDFFKYMQQLSSQFEVIVLDPPAFAKDRRAVKSGIKGYRSINEAAFRALPKGGVLFTFSCSQLVSREDFRNVVAESAAAAGRPARVLHQLFQAPCHPVHLSHPEGEYLKGLVVRVD